MNVFLTDSERVARVVFAMKLFIMTQITSAERYYDIMVRQGGYLVVADSYYKESGLLRQAEVDDLYQNAILPRVIEQAAVKVEREIFGRAYVEDYKAEDHAGQPIPVPH